ncbi:MAG: hypothetical protein PF569_08965 [Candidatus Woesearchaeota archaeon]|jgi:hypothetical protein|nr:hypothetical protein [Candidatus Woesearchaeota archaeon]
MQMKKMKKILLTIILFSMFLPQILAIDEDINSYEYLKLNINQKIDFQVEIEQDSNINYFYITSNFFPKTYEESQYLNNYTTTNPDYKIIEDDTNYMIKYSYTDETIKEKNSISNTFTLESTKSTPKIKKKVEYPIKNKDSENQVYIEFTELIDTNSEIKKKASELAYSEDDTYIIAVKIADWIQNDITYDLSTVTENPNQKSSQVFTSKTGVCKEITNLYVSMMRSLGIPARTVSGYAYTNSEEVIEFVGSNWGGHAWSEILIGETWVPFDLTYSQYGYIDASHIIISKNANLQQNSVSINASGYGINLVENSLKTSTKFEIEEKEKKIFDYGYQITIDGTRELSPESYGYLEIKVKNTKDYYKVIDLKIAKTEEIELLGQNKKLTILKPDEEKTIYFKYKIPELDTKFIYTFPFTIYNNDFQENLSLEVKKGYENILKSELPKDIIQETSMSNNQIIINCNSTYNLPENIYSCTLKNPNNHEINNINICSENDCEIFSLLLNEEKIIEFKSEKLNQSIIVKYSNQTNTQILEIEPPKLDCEAKKNANKITLNCQTKNIVENLKITLNLNNKTITKTNKNEFEKLLVLEHENNEIKVELEYKNQIINMKKIDIQLSPEELPKTGFSKYFSNMLKWITELFS